jgi:hypothetical protein
MKLKKDNDIRESESIQKEGEMILEKVILAKRKNTTETAQLY